MFDALESPDLSLVLGPDDSVIQVGTCTPPGRGRHVAATVQVVVHRRHGLWTHVYRVLQGDRPGRLLIFLHKVFEGERIDEARRWAVDNLVRGPA